MKNFTIRPLCYCGKVIGRTALPKMELFRCDKEYICFVKTLRKGKRNVTKRHEKQAK